jgi:hypothetical protein
MVFRDDREALSERVDALDQELRAARDEIAHLKGGTSPNNAERSAFFGAPLRVELVREIPGEISEETKELIVDELRRRFGRAGQVTALGHSLTWSVEPTEAQPSRAVQVSVRSRNGRTVIRAIERNGMLAGGLFGGLGGGMGLGLGVGAVIALALSFGPLLALVGGLSWLALVYLLARTIFVAVTRSRRAELATTLEVLVDLAREETAAAPAAVAPERTGVRADVSAAPTEPLESERDDRESEAHAREPGAAGKLSRE